MRDESILIVEDNPDEAELMLDALRKAGVEQRLVVAQDGVEALDYLFGADNAPPVLTLLDLKLPRLSGLDVLRRIRGEPATSHLPVVAMTSSTEDEDERQCHALGCSEFMRRPTHHGQFVSMIGELVARRLSGQGGSGNAG